MFTTLEPGHYQPLAWVTYGVDYVLWGLEPGGYHLTSLLLHGVNAVLFFLLALELLPSRDAVLPAAFSALFFALHPLRVESVAWATERRDVLSGLFYLLALLSYVHEPGRRRATFGFYALGLLSKISVITLPATLLVLDAFILGRLPTDPRRWAAPGARRALLEKWPFAVAGLAAGALGVYTQSWAGAVRSLGEVPLSVRLAMSAYSYSFYLAKTVLPSSLQPYYPVPAGFGLLHPAAAGSLVVLAGSAYGAWAARRRLPAFTASLLGYAIAIAPMLGLVKIGDQLVADRYAYLPCMAWAILSGAGFQRLLAFKQARPAALAGALVLSAALGRASWSQTHAWRDSVTLWRHALALNPGNALAHNQLASALAEAGGAVEEIVFHLREAVRLDPGNPSARLNLGVHLLREGSLTEAAGHFEAASRLNPAVPEAYDLLGTVREREGRLREAIGLYRQALARDERYGRARYNLAAALAAAGEAEAAAAVYREAVRRDPPNPDAHNNLGLLLAARGDARGAVAEFRQALRVRPAHAAAHHNWGNLLSDRGALEEAARHYAEALRIEPGFTAARFNLGNTRARQGRWDEALSCWRDVLRAEPGNAAARESVRKVTALRGR